MKSTSLKQIAEWVDGSLSAESSVSISDVGIDSRTLVPGSLFIAIKGQNFDAHEFIDQGRLDAGESNAAALIVSREVKANLPQILVKDTRIALGELAKKYRQTLNCVVLTVTGSNGKTSVKEMLASICCEKGATLATSGNLNNDYGVPLTILSINAEDYAVIEMGANHHGEISYLTNIACGDVAIITNAGAAHLEGFGSIDGVAKAKGEIFEGLSKTGTAVINLDDSRHQVWLDLAKGKKVVSFGLKEEADYSAKIKVTNEGTLVSMKSLQGKIEFNLRLLGVHNVLNALSASAACYAIGIDLASIKQGLEKMSPVKGRLQWKTGEKGMRLLDDTYNANPTSLAAALNVLANLGTDNWLILGDMGELGDGSSEMHEEAGRLARRAGISRLLTFGENARYASDFFGEGGKHFAKPEELLDTVHQEWKGDGAILVKGSRAMQMERFVDALANNKLNREDS